MAFATDRSAALTALVSAGIVVLVAVLSVTLPAGSGLGAAHNPELADYFGHDNAGGQRLAHQIGVALLAVGALLGPWIGPRLTQASVTAGRLAERLTAGALVVWWASALAVTGMRTDLAPVGLLLGLGLLVLWARRALSVPQRVYAVLTALALAGVVVLPIAQPLDLSTAGAVGIAHVELHDSWMLDPGYRVALGQTIYDDFPAAYGAVVAGVLGLLGRGIDLTWHHHIVFLRLCNAAFVAGALWLAYRQSRGRWDVVLLVLALALPTWNVLGKGLILPNHSAARLFPFLGGLLVLEALRPGTWARTAAAGALAGWLLLFNVETGIAGAAGIGAYVWLRQGGLARPADALSHLAALLGGTALGVASFLVTWRLVLGHVPPLLHPQGWLWPITAAGDDGLPSLAMTYDPLAVFVFGWAAYALLRAAWKPKPGPVRHRVALRAACATVLLVWALYYFHRPYEHKLLAYLTVSGILLADLWPLLSRGRGGPRVSPGPWAVATTLALVVAPVGFHYGVDALATVGPVARQAVVGPAKPDAVRVSGVWFSAPDAAHLQTKAERLREEGRAGPVAVLTAFPFSQPRLSGVPPVIYAHHLFSELRTRRAQDELVADWQAAGPPTILVDDPADGFVGSEAEVRWQQRMIDELAPAYAVAETADGWRVLRRVP